MTYPGSGGDPLAGLDPTDEERLAVYEALDEVEAEEAGPDLDPDLGGDPDESGPWDDQLDVLGAIGDQVDHHYATAAVVAAEDAEDAEWFARRPSAEDRAARALDRIGAGTYTPPAYFRGDPAAAAAARDPLGRYAAACGPLDDFARCSARYHTPQCHTSVESAAVRGSAGEAETWRDVLTGRAQPPGTDAQSLGLATPSGPGPGSGAGDAWADLLDSGPGLPEAELRARVLHQMGETGPAPPPPREGPDVSGIRAALGI